MYPRSPRAHLPGFLHPPCLAPTPQVDDKSSQYDPGSFSVRRDGSYVYEEFLPTGARAAAACL
jgi:hypothetical protein